MGQGKKLDDKTKSNIKAYLLECGNVRQTARRFKVAEATVRKIRDEEDDFAELHAQKKTEWINEAWKTINLYVQHVQEEEVVKRTGARDSAILIGTLHDKMIKSEELAIKREELDIRRKEQEEKSKGPDAPNISVYVNALKEQTDVWDEDE